MELDGLDPAKIDAAKQAKSKKVREPTELEKAKEERLMAKELRMSMGAKPGESKKGVAFDTPAPVPQEPTPEMRSHLLDQLSAYRERFPGLKERNKINGKRHDNRI